MSTGTPRSLRFEVSAKTSASPSEVIEIAGKDFSERRAKVWPNVRTSKLILHDDETDHAVVTEGGTGPARFLWEKCRYEWPRAGLVTSRVVDSNALLPGTTFELQASPDGSGSEVTMVLDRRFRPGGWGRAGYALNRVVGRRGFAYMLRQALKGVEKQSRAASS